MAFKRKISLPATRQAFILILLLAAFLRLYQLDKFPVSLNWDEISHSYNAYSILKTGKDQWGTKMPIFNFRAYGDYPTTLNMYLTIPWVKFLGLNAWSTRLPSAICGIVIVIFAYLITESLLKNKLISLSVMFLAAISPWTLFTSRAAFQSTVAQAFLLIGIYFLINFLFNQKRTLFASLIFFNLSMYGYHSSRIFVPLFLLVILIVYFKPIKKNFFAFIIGILLMLPIFLNFFNPESRARSTWVSILNPSAINTINESRRLFNGPPFLARIIYNKVSYSVPILIKNTLNFFNPIPLFITGSRQYQFNVANHGLIYLICLPFFYYGLFIIFQQVLKHKDQKYLFLLLWYLIGLVPAMITTGDFPTLRLFLIIPLPFIAISLALNKNKKILPYFIFLISCSLIYYLYLYTTSYARNYSASWQAGYQEAVTYIKENYNQYEQIIFTKKYGEPHEFILFYWPYDPAKYQQMAQTDYHASWYWVNAFDKFIFINDWEIKEKTKNLSRPTLIITSPNNFNPDAKLLKTIYLKDKTPAFDIVAVYEK